MDFPDAKRQNRLELVNSVLIHPEGEFVKKPRASVSLTHITVQDIMSKQTTLKDAVTKGNVIIGDQSKLNDVFGSLDNF